MKITIKFDEKDVDTNAAIAAVAEMIREEQQVGKFIPNMVLAIGLDIEQTLTHAGDRIFWVTK